MSSDWEDEGVETASALLPIENLELMAAMLMAVPRIEKRRSNGSVDDSYAEFPAVLQTMLCRAAESLKEAGCCSSRNQCGTGRDSQIFGIATELTSRIAAKSAAICLKVTGYRDGEVFNCSGLHGSILKTISE